MYAIIKTGGKQYRVSEGDKIKVEQLDQEKGASFDISEVLFVGGDKTQIGKPFVAGATVTVEVARQLRDKKIRVFKKKRRKGYQKLNGHRQLMSQIQIESISASGSTKKAAKKAAPKKEETKAEAKAETASSDLSSLTVAELKKMASDKGLTGYSSMKKAELIEALS